MLRRLLAVVLVALCTACGGGGDGSPKAAGGPGFTLEVPAGWRVLDAQTALDAAEEEVDDALLQSILRDLQKPNSPLKLFAFDPKIERGFATNANVLVLPAQDGVGLDEWAEAEVEDVHRYTGEVRDRPVELPAGRAVRLDYRSTRFGDQEVAIVQHLLQKGSRRFVVTLTTLPGREDAYADELETVTQSLRLD